MNDLRNMTDAEWELYDEERRESEIQSYMWCFNVDRDTAAVETKNT